MTSVDALCATSTARLRAANAAYLLGCKRAIALRVVRLPPELIRAIGEASTPGRTCEEVRMQLRHKYGELPYDGVYNVRRVLGLRSARGRKSSA